ncbi:N-acetylmuramoyl-L-alanine amidase [Geodermatophilus ruber]|uniref:N-acetylmuramoyl-L-alanine amidase n=1 Tax=Geodermatophilus ruber TaxID=504800 RepID=A0A1I4LNI4_9ACTN|nr:N-acetylmuramoyl-L-alanine amidase [Geodermatophilus ruber]SFL92525.1 N-acetylmuramoyl-L-alanine amidase [Geodermatophilus ruber]
MRRLLGGSSAFLVLTGTLLVLPVYAAPTPEAEPVAPSIEAVDLGSVDQPEDAAVVTADGAVVDAGPEAEVAPPAAGQPAPPAATDEVASSGEEISGVPALTVSRPDAEPFSAVGVTWAQDGAVTAVTVQLRTRSEAGRWGEWTTVEQDDVEQEEPSASADVRGGTAPVWTGPARGVEVIVQAADGSTPRDVQVELIDPGTSAADAAPGTPEITDQAHAAATMPPVYSRAQWGADESLMTWGAEYAPTIKAATIHHTADGNTYTAADVPGILRSMYAYHAVSRGWGDIGYNVIVDKFGRAWEGRAGGLASTVVGAHAGGFNTGTFGVSMLGNYDLVAPPQVMLETVASVVAWKLSLYGVDPKGTTTLTSGGGGTAKYAAGEQVTLPTVFGHRDVGSTACPGKYAYSRMGDIRAMVAAKWVPGGGPVAAQSLLRNSNTPGGADVELIRGDRGDRPLACDWNGDGAETVGVFRKGRFILFDSNAQEAKPVADFWFGNTGDRPLCGDWDGDGKDSVGVWRAGWFYLRNANTTGPAQGAFPFGNVNAQPVAGNWDGDLFDTVGVYQGNVFYWTNTNLRPSASGKVPFGAGADRLVTGDWTGAGRDTIGVHRSTTFYLTNSLTRASTDAAIPYGDVADVALLGDWDGNGIDTLGVSRGY